MHVEDLAHINDTLLVLAQAQGGFDEDAAVCLRPPLTPHASPGVSLPAAPRLPGRGGLVPRHPTHNDVSARLLWHGNGPSASHACACCEQRKRLLAIAALFADVCRGGLEVTREQEAILLERLGRSEEERRTAGEAWRPADDAMPYALVPRPVFLCPSQHKRPPTPACAPVHHGGSLP